MSISSRLYNYYSEARGNLWFHGFAWFCRITLAIGFIIAGLVKIGGERFAAGLSVNNPMGHYLEALYYTEYYYTFIGISQLIVAILLVIPRTALLGALMYFPVILNVCILTYAVRFEGTRATTFMLLASMFLLCWDYDRLKRIVQADQRSEGVTVRKKPLNKKFPFPFFALVVAMLATVVIGNLHIYDIRPGNEPAECTNMCPGNSDPVACDAFCDCIYVQGRMLRDCLAEYHAGKSKLKSKSKSK